MCIYFVVWFFLSYEMLRFVKNEFDIFTFSYGQYHRFESKNLQTIYSYMSSHTMITLHWSCPISGELIRQPAYDEIRTIFAALNFIAMISIPSSNVCAVVLQYLMWFHWTRIRYLAFPTRSLWSHPVAI